MKNLLERVYELVIKLISMKGIALILGTVAVFSGLISGEIWLGILTLVIAGRTVDKLGLGK